MTARDHRAAIAALPPDLRAELTATSDARGLAHLAGHLALIVASGAWVMAGPIWALGLPVLGVGLIFLFTLEHECTHRTPFRSTWLNDWVGRACGVVLVLPFEWFRYFHFAHHRHTNLPGLDPELDGPKPATLAEWAVHVSGLPYWIAAIRLMARLALGRECARYLPEAALPRMEREARWMVGLYAAGAASLIWTDALIWLWAVPVLIGQPVLRLYLLAEHGDAPQVANMLENSRTTFTTRMVRFLAWNMPYHAEHHALPTVPFHALPRLHDALRADLGLTADGYARFSRDYLNRRRGQAGGGPG